MINLMSVFSAMTSKGFHYFEGETNSKDNHLFFNFSKEYKGRGDSISLELTENGNELQLFQQEGKREHKTNLSDPELLVYLNNL